MELSKCLVCLKDCLPRTNGTKGEEIIIGLTNDNDTVETELDVTFILKKILGIPENIFSKLQKYGDLNFLIDCCESCSVLIEKANKISTEMMLLEKQFKNLQYLMTHKIVQSVRSAENKIYFNSEANKTVRSYVHLAFAEAVVKVENIQNSEDWIVGSPPYVSLPPGPDDEFSDIDSDADEEIDQTNQIHKWDTKIEDPGEFLEIDYRNTCITVGTATFPEIKEEEQSFDLVESPEIEIIEFPEITGEKPYKCGKCSKGFNYLPELQIHIQAHSGNEKTLKCDMCEKTFKTVQSLKSHVKVVHKGERPFKCGICEKRFTRMSKLTIHVKAVHYDEKPFKCDLCGKRFTQVTCLSRHVKTVHNRERPFKCDVCEKRFGQLSNLETHVKTVHNGEKRFKCEVCEKRFPFLYKLNLHVKTVHNGERPFKCNMCEKRFSEMKTLKHHQQKLSHGVSVENNSTYPFL